MKSSLTDFTLSIIINVQIKLPLAHGEVHFTFVLIGFAIATADGFPYERATTLTFAHSVLTLRTVRAIHISAEVCKRKTKIKSSFWGNFKSLLGFLVEDKQCTCPTPTPPTHPPPHQRYPPMHLESSISLWNRITVADYNSD